jgi:hypothetical protein
MGLEQKYCVSDVMGIWGMFLLGNISQKPMPDTALIHFYP